MNPLTAVADLEKAILAHVSQYLEQQHGLSPAAQPPLVLSATREGHTGDRTLVLFPLAKLKIGNPEELGQALGATLVGALPQLSDYYVVKGFLNLSFSDVFWAQWLTDAAQQSELLLRPKVATPERVMVEYSSPNTNKPLHLGHMRNIFLGYSLAQILEAVGHTVVRANLVNDRGIHICKSMLAWQRFGNGETPESSGLKGDHLVGKYYVVFDREANAQAQQLVQDWLAGTQSPTADPKINPDTKTKLVGLLTKHHAPDTDENLRKELTSKLKDIAKLECPLYREAQEMLRRWEAGDAATVTLWQTMNGWVYSGFDATYRRMGVQFDQYYYESNTYLLGKDIVDEGLRKGVFYKKEDGSVWIDLRPDGLDEKLVLRGDGTSVYITQDMGTADLKYRDHHCDRSIYVVGNEQDYHFQVLKLIMQKLGRPYANGIQHLSYGMVELPEGKMKSREGTVVDADDLMNEMLEEARAVSQELGKASELPDAEAEATYRILGLGALKYYLLKVDPPKKMLFNPAESIDLKGHTGPFIQYALTRARRITEKAQAVGIVMIPHAHTPLELDAEEKILIKELNRYPALLQEAAEKLSPALLANFLYELAKVYNRFYYETPILKADGDIRAFRLTLNNLSAEVLHSGLRLLGIEAPERM